MTRSGTVRTWSVERTNNMPALAITAANAPPSAARLRGITADVSAADSAAETTIGEGDTRRFGRRGRRNPPHPAASVTSLQAMPGRTLLAVHAHPDDECIGTGGVLARYA